MWHKICPRFSLIIPNFLLILIPTFFHIFPIVFFSRMVNSLSSLKTVATLYFNSTSNTDYDFFPTLHPVSFKQPRYYSNRLPCFATNKEGSAVLINAKRSTKKKSWKQKKNTTLRNDIFPERSFYEKYFHVWALENLIFAGKHFLGWHFLLFLSRTSSCARVPQVIWSWEISILIYLLEPPNL